MAGVREAIVAGLTSSLLGWGAIALADTRGEVKNASSRELRVDGIDVEQVAHLTPGTVLRFSVFGTPAADATLRIRGASRTVPLEEVLPGVYEGSYTIDAQDRIGPGGRVTATLRREGLVVQSVLEEPLQFGADPLASATPVERSPSGPEREPIGRTPTLRVGKPVPPAEPLPSGIPPAAAECGDCARVESIQRVVDHRGAPGYAGAIAGGLLGAILGDQVGHGAGRRVARVLGAVGGALAGAQLERDGDGRVRYEVVLRLPSGDVQRRSYDSAPPFNVGDTVRVRLEARAVGTPRGAVPF
jgi:outer membrane lipoprotein SlyB